MSEEIMEDYPSNSHKKKAEASAPEEKPEKQIRRVTVSDPIQRKKPLMKRFKENFFGGNGVGVLSYITWDVLIPAAKDTVADVVTQGVERSIYGEARSSSRRTGYRPGGASPYTAYNRAGAPSVGSRPDPRERDRNPSRRSRASHNLTEIVMPTRVEAEEVLRQMFDILGEYPSVSVAEFYESVGVEANFTDRKWGWTNLSGADVERVRDGYVLVLPRPDPLD